MKSQFFFTLILGMLLGAALGCNGSSNAAGSSTAPAIFLLAPNEKASVSQVRTYAVDTGEHTTSQTTPSSCPAGSIGTLTGRGGTPFSSSVEYGVSCTGAYFGIDTGTGVLSGLLDNQSVLYDQPGCVGKAYVSPSYSTFNVPSISQAAVNNGAVFRVDPQNLGASDASTYVYLPAGEAGDSTVVITSVYVYGTGCQSATVGPGITMYALQPNDVTLSGENSAPVALPVVTGSGG